MVLEKQIESMISAQLVSRGITDPHVLTAMRRIPRHEFIPPQFQDRAYDDGPVPIGEGQTISQPYMVALMTQSLELAKNDEVLEIGTGSGYQTAVLAQICREVHTIERLQDLSERARILLSRLGYKNIHFKVADGSRGWDDTIKFDAILVGAGGPEIPASLVGQLKEGGRLIFPLGERTEQVLTLVRLVNGRIQMQEICRCTFVPLIGQEGWSS